jgi:hypothetical protein
LWSITEGVETPLLAQPKDPLGHAGTTLGGPIKIASIVISITLERPVRTYCPGVGIGVTAMTPTLWTRKQLAFIVAIVALLFTAAFLSIGLVHSEPFSDANLGAEWQCTKLAGVLTTCSKIQISQPVVHTSHKSMLCLRRA